MKICSSSFTDVISGTLRKKCVNCIDGCMSKKLLNVECFYDKNIYKKNVRTAHYDKRIKNYFNLHRFARNIQMVPIKKL